MSKAALSLVVALTLHSVVSAGPILNPANGHYYELVIGNQISWTNANTAANGMTFLGSTGHLATITSQSESDFLQANFASSIGDPNTNVPGIFGWIGLTDQASEGSFQWVTGEPLSFTDWAPFEPNNLGNEDFVAIWRRDFGNGPLWSWNDFNNVGNVATTGYFVEYDGSFTPVPEPSSLILFVVALLSTGIGSAVLQHSKYEEEHDLWMRVTEN